MGDFYSEKLAVGNTSKYLKDTSIIRKLLSPKKKNQSHLIPGSLKLASFPGSPLVLMGKKGRGEPGIDSHVISQHDTFALTIK